MLTIITTPKLPNRYFIPMLPKQFCSLDRLRFTSKEIQREYKVLQVWVASKSVMKNIFLQGERAELLAEIGISTPPPDSFYLRIIRHLAQKAFSDAMVEVNGPRFRPDLLMFSVIVNGNKMGSIAMHESETQNTFEYTAINPNQSTYLTALFTDWCHTLNEVTQ